MWNLKTVTETHFIAVEWSRHIDVVMVMIAKPKLWFMRSAGLNGNLYYVMEYTL